MKQPLRTGINFGVTSGIITTLGLMVGLEASTSSKAVVMAGILTIALADAMSDALGIHITEEANDQSTAHIWAATLATLVSKAFITSLFIIPFLFFNIELAVMIGVFFGLVVLGFLSYAIAKGNGTNPLIIVLEHILIATLVVVLTYVVGTVLQNNFYN